MTALERVARWLQQESDSRFLSDVLQPVLADLQHELFERPTTPIRRRIKCVQAAWALVKAALLFALTRPHPVFRALTGFVASTLAFTLMLAWIAFPELLEHANAARLFAHLLPQALSLAVVLGFGVSLLLIPRERIARHRGALWAAALLTVLAVAVSLQTITPTHNQRFREELFGGHVTRGANELTWTELLEQVEAQGPADFREATDYPPPVFFLHVRVALTLLPIALLVLHRSARTTVPMLVALAGILLWHTCVPPSQITAAMHVGCPASLLAWIPDLMLIVAWAGIKVSRRTALA